MKIAPPPRPVPDSTRSPATPSFAHDLEARAQVVDARPAHVGERERRARVPGVGNAPRDRRSSTRRSHLQLHLARRIAELVALRGLAELDAAREVLQPQLVIEVQLVEERRREEIEVAGRARASRDRGGRSSRCAGTGSPGAGSAPRSAAARPCPRPISKESSRRASSGSAASRASSTTIASPK